MTLTHKLIQQIIITTTFCFVQVATWVDDSLSLVANKLEHSVQLFAEFQTDKVVSLHTCSLYTCARLESGALYWWYAH